MFEHPMPLGKDRSTSYYCSHAIRFQHGGDSFMLGEFLAIVKGHEMEKLLVGP